MQKITLVFQLVLTFLLVLFVILLTTRCTRVASDDANHESCSRDNVQDSCGVCFVDSFSVKASSKIGAGVTVITHPVAIQFFNQVRLADKYEKSSYDTLMKLFKMKDADDRKVIYALKNQYFYFVKEIKPFLIKNSIAIMDSVSGERLLEFRNSTFSVVVDPNEYKDRDGILFFQPGKKPIFWTADKEDRYCQNATGMVSQYFLCPETNDITR